MDTEIFTRDSGVQYWVYLWNNQNNGRHKYPRGHFVLQNISKNGEVTFEGGK